MLFNQLFFFYLFLNVVVGFNFISIGMLPRFYILKMKRILPNSVIFIGKH